MTHMPKYVRIRDMIISFLRRWFVLNRLYHYTVKIRGFVGSTHEIDKGHFIDWITGIPQQDRLPEWRFSPLEPSQVNYFFIERMHFLFSFSRSNIDYLIRQLTETINECEKMGYVSLNLPFDKVNLTAHGLDVYSISYLIFGHEYARKIWTGVIVVVVGGILMHMFNSVLNPKNTPVPEVRYDLRNQHYRR